jgi:DNA-binding NarL/FixJ family response regulator
MSVLEAREAMDATFLLQVVDSLAFGVIVADAALERIHFMNRAGARIVATAGGPIGRLPAPLGRALAHARTSVTISDRELLLEMSALPGSPDRVLLTLTKWDEDVVDLHGLLHRRYGLSSRELQVVDWLRAGLRNREIAERMALTVATVKSYVGNVLAAVQVRNRTELVALIERIAAKRG